MQCSAALLEGPRKERERVLFLSPSSSVAGGRWRQLPALAAAAGRERARKSQAPARQSGAHSTRVKEQPLVGACRTAPARAVIKMQSCSRGQKPSFSPSSTDESHAPNCCVYYWAYSGTPTPSAPSPRVPSKKKGGRKKKKKPAHLSRFNFHG